MLRACDVDIERLREDLTTFLDRDLAGLATGAPGDPKPTAGFQRVVQRAAIHVKSSGRDEVHGGNVLMAMFSERESHAVYFLEAREMTRLDAANWLSHGLTKAAAQAGVRADPAPERNQPDAESLCNVLLHDDDITPISFLAGVLERVFERRRDDTLRLLLEMHTHGSAVCGSFPRDAAEAKLAYVTAMARQQKFPLRCTLEPI
jgi:ATP-dependent Clp protease adapter protein ClpS